MNSIPSIPGIIRSQTTMSTKESRRKTSSPSLPLTAGNAGFHDVVFKPVDVEELSAKFAEMAAVQSRDCSRSALARASDSASMVSSRSRTPFLFP